MIPRTGPIVVVKLGGSLLDWPEWPTHLATLLGRRPADRVVLIVGGGRFADHLRDLDQIHALGEARSHHLALRLLDATAHLAAALLPGSVVADEVVDLPLLWDRGQIPILAPRRFLDADDHSPDPLPHTWTTTTDSIAARVAVRLFADELILLKSTSLPPDLIDWRAAADLGLVDPEFARAVAGLDRVSLVDFRGDGDQSAAWSSSSSGRSLG